MEVNILPYSPEHAEGVLNVFNYFVEHSYAAYPEKIVGKEWISAYEEKTKGMPSYVVEQNKQIVGFFSLHPYHKYSTFKGCAEITYFILPEYTGKGLGKRILNKLISEARERGINNILASISSLNEQSLNFHKKYGFKVAGEFKDIGEKFGKRFSVIYMQLSLR